MNTIKLGMMAAALAAWAGPAPAEPAFPGLGRLQSLSFEAGISGSRLAASGEQADYFHPLPRVRPLTSPDFAAEAGFRIAGPLTATTGLRIDRFGQSTPATPVEIQGDDFPHTFRARTALTYAGVPAYLGWRGTFAGQWLALRAGALFCVIEDKENRWMVDGADPAPGAPEPGLDDAEARLLLGAEYGVRFGAWGAFAAAEVQRGVHPLAWGLPGRTTSRAATAGLGLRRYFGDR